MAAGIVVHNITTAAGVTYELAVWVPDTALPNVGCIPVHKPLTAAGAVYDLADVSTQLQALTALITGGRFKVQPTDINGNGADFGLPNSVVGPGTVLNVSPVIDTSAYVSGDVLFVATAMSSAVRVAAGQAMLHSVIATDESDQGFGLDLIFFDANATLGTINAPPNISDADSRSIIGTVQIASTDWIDLGGNRVATISNVGIRIKAAAAATTLYVAGISRGTGTYAADAIRFKFGLLWD